MVQHPEAFATKPEDLHLIPERHMVEKKRLKKKKELNFVILSPARHPPLWSGDMG